LKHIQSYFGGIGSIVKEHGKDTSQFVVTSIKQITTVILPHFDNYPLITKKSADYLLFKKAVNLMNNKEHLTMEGLRKIIAIKASINLGLSDKLKAAFPNTIPAPRPLTVDQKIPNPIWVAGFTEGEGSFFITIYKSGTTKTGFAVRLTFSLGQHFRDVNLINSLVEFFDCGQVNLSTFSPFVTFRVTKFSNINERIIPRSAFFLKYPLIGGKALDCFKLWESSGTNEK